mmetsp:Transcript_7828/g.17067  ORF Transcript_7828/g.17067 Transcript_7828/m.17067 type:complete len:90 (+) Transcript_7828:268-537(+)
MLVGLLVPRKMVGRRLARRPESASKRRIGRKKRDLLHLSTRPTAASFSKKERRLTPSDLQITTNGVPGRNSPPRKTNKRSAVEVRCQFR